MYRSPCRQERSASRVGGAGRATARTEGVILSSWVFCVFTCNICLNKLTTLSLRDIPPLKPFERRDHSTDMYGGYLNTDPADVALVSPQTPLIPLYNPLLAGGYSKAISSDSLLLASFQWVFCVFTCNHPPQQTLLPEPSALPSSQAFREEGQTSRYIR